MVVQLNKQLCSGKRLKVTFHISKSSPNAEVLRGILDSPDGIRIAKEKALDAIRAFWLPTYRQEAGYPAPQLKDAARMAIWRLQEQIHYLQSLYGLEAVIEIPTVAGYSKGKQDRTNLEAPLKLEIEAKKADVYDPQQLDWSFDEAELGGVAS